MNRLHLESCLSWGGSPSEATEADRAPLSSGIAAICGGLPPQHSQQLAANSDRASSLDDVAPVRAIVGPAAEVVRG